jgi:Protein of unknown function, DUF547
MFRCWTLIIALIFVTGCASVPRPGGSSANGASTVGASVSPPPYAAWGRVLQRFVDDLGRVDFAAIAKDQSDLDQFVAYVYDNGPNNRPQLFPTQAHVLAFHLNSYNALAMHKVIAIGIPQTNAGFRKVAFFAFGKVQVGQQPISLYDYENKVIRPIGDPRVHWALNCMSVSCPQLPREVFLPETVDAQLQRETLKFFGEMRNVDVDHVNKVVRLSEILKFYPEDFLAKSPSLIAYANQYLKIKIPEDYKLEFIPYDWTINRQPSP